MSRAASHAAHKKRILSGEHIPENVACVSCKHRQECEAIKRRSNMFSPEDDPNMTERMKPLPCMPT